MTIFHNENFEYFNDQDFWLVDFITFTYCPCICKFEEITKDIGKTLVQLKIL